MVSLLWFGSSGMVPVFSFEGLPPLATLASPAGPTLSHTARPFLNASYPLGDVRIFGVVRLLL